MVNTLLVKMNNIIVGKLSKNTSGQLSFAYDKKWLLSKNARPISLSLPLLNTEFTGDIVYHFFDNLLPDNPQIKARIQAHFHAKTDQPFDLLSHIGQDCVGAIQLVTDHHRPKTGRAMQYHVLKTSEIAALLRGITLHPLGMQSHYNDFRISLAGAQQKTALLLWKNKWCLPEKTTPSTHIFKLPIGKITHQAIDLSDSCENEWLCAQIAAAFNLSVATCTLHYFEKVKCLVVTRFDRQRSADGKIILRLPQEDMCQALGYSPNLKYEADGGPGITSIMQLLLGSISPTEDRDHFFKSQILFYLLAAIDGHAKNFSIQLLPKSAYRLAPLYDIFSAYPLISSKQLDVHKIKLSMAWLGKNKHYNWNQIKHRHFLSTANKSHYSIESAEKIITGMLNNIDRVIEKVSASLPKKFPMHIAEPIFKGMLQAKTKIL